MNTIVTFYRTLNKITKSLFFISIALIVYGFISQHAPIYFFWESERIGWTVLIVAVILASIQGIGYVKQKGKKPYGPYIVMGFFAFSLLINGILRLIIPHTEVYSAGYDYLNIESKELGQIISIRNLPELALTFGNNNGSFRTVKLLYLVKGSKKYEKVILQLHKEDNTNWVVVKKINKEVNAHWVVVKKIAK